MISGTHARAEGETEARAKAAKMVFGQVVMGPPGSGKTTYCAGMLRHMASIGAPAVPSAAMAPALRLRRSPCRPPPALPQLARVLPCSCCAERRRDL